MSSTLPLLESSSHYPGETAIRIDSYLAGGVFLALTQAYLARAARITFSTTPDQVTGPSSAAPPGTANLLGQDSNLTPGLTPGLTPLTSRTSLLPTGVRTHTERGIRPELHS